jgi:hypothetical protein
MLRAAAAAQALLQRGESPRLPSSSSLSTAEAFAFREIGAGFQHKNPAVCAFSGYAGHDANAFPGSKSRALFTTSFDALGADEVTVVRDFGAAVAAGGASFADEVVETNTLWPNMVTMLPPSEFGAPALLLAGGFLVPGKTPGSIDVLLFDNSTGSATPASQFKVSTDQKGFFYHVALLHDMDGDGDSDVVAARAKDPALPWEQKASQLVWLERPADKPAAGGWKEHLLFENGLVGLVGGWVGAWVAGWLAGWLAS